MLVAFPHYVNIDGYVTNGGETPSNKKWHIGVQQYNLCPMWHIFCVPAQVGAGPSPCSACPLLSSPGALPALPAPPPIASTFLVWLLTVLPRKPLELAPAPTFCHEYSRAVLPWGMTPSRLSGSPGDSAPVTLSFSCISHRCCSPGPFLTQEQASCLQLSS